MSRTLLEGLDTELQPNSPKPGPQRYSTTSTSHSITTCRNDIKVDAVAGWDPILRQASLFPRSLSPVKAILVQLLLCEEFHYTSLFQLINNNRHHARRRCCRRSRHN